MRLACLPLLLIAAWPSTVFAQDQKIEAIQFPIVTRTQSDSVDPSLPESSPAPLAEAPPVKPYIEPRSVPAVPIRGEVAAEIARQLEEARPGVGEPPGVPVKPQHRIYATREPAGSILATGIARPLPAPVAFMPAVAAVPVKPVDETAVLSRMMGMNRSQVMRGVADTVNRTGGVKPARHAARASRQSTRVEAQPLHPSAGTGIRRIDPDPSGKRAAHAPP